MVRHRAQRFFEGMFGTRKLTLEGVLRAKVHVHGAIISPNAVLSPVSPVKACVLSWTLLHRVPSSNSDGRDAFFFRPFAFHVSAHDFIVQTKHGTVLVPADHADVRFAIPLTRNPQSLMGAPPAALSDALQQDESDYEIFYSERYIGFGDKVALRAEVERGNTTAGAYRGAPAAADYLVLLDEDAPRVTELWTGG